MAGGEQAVAQENLEKARKLIEDLEKKGCQVSEARGWYDQAKDMFKSGLFRTSIIYSSYALDAGNEMVQRIKDMVLRVTKVKARAVDQLGKDNKHMPAIDDMIVEMKKAINEGRLDDCQELIAQVDEVLRGGSSPYISTTSTARAQVVKTAQPSRGYSSCPSCGNIVESDWTDCKYCGQGLKEETDTGPAWSRGEGGPLMVSDEQTEEDAREQERTEKDMERVESDLDETQHEMAREAERTVDERTESDMSEQESIGKEEERTEADIEVPPPLPPALPPALPPPLPPSKTADEETSTDMQDQEKIEQSMEKVEADLEGPGPEQQIAPPVNPEFEERKGFHGQLTGWRERGYDVSRLEKILGSDLPVLRQEFQRYANDVEKLEALSVRFYKLKDPRAKKIEPFLKKPDEVEKLEKVIEKMEAKDVAQPPQEAKPAPPAEVPDVKPPPPPPPEVKTIAEAPDAKPTVEKPPPPPPPPPPPEAPKKFFIPPPPKLSFDDIKLPPLPTKGQAGPRKCQSCGEEVDADFKTCPFCKSPLNK